MDRAPSAKRGQRRVASLGRRQGDAVDRAPSAKREPTSDAEAERQALPSPRSDAVGSASFFDYELPPGRIAAYPAPRRPDSRLLVLHRATGRIQHRRFRDLPDLLVPDDLLVVNDTRVLPARLLGRKPTGAAAEVLLLRPARPAGGAASTDAPVGPSGAAAPVQSDSPSGTAPTAAPVGSSGAAAPPGATPTADHSRTWEALVRPGTKLRPGRTVEVAPELSVRIVDDLPGGGRLVRLDTPLPVREALSRFGRIPLPPYLKREDEPLDRVRYQTVYAREEGSVAAPTAGLHFDDELLEAVEARGASRCAVTLHVGPGTFRPVEVENPADHKMHGESYHVPERAAEAHRRCRERGGRAWAVGTTVVRALESAWASGPAGVRPGRLRPGGGATDLFIRPPYRFRAVDCLITNFHLPRSTLLMLVSAFGGADHVRRAYQEAVDAGYRFYSYGDAMAVLR